MSAKLASEMSTNAGRSRCGSYRSSLSRDSALVAGSRIHRSQRLRIVLAGDDIDDGVHEVALNGLCGAAAWSNEEERRKQMQQGAPTCRLLIHPWNPNM